MYLSCDFPSYKDLEESGAYFTIPETYTGRTNIGERGKVYIIPKDNERYIFPATIADNMPNKDIFDAIILCSAYTLGNKEVRKGKVFGLLAECVDDGGGNNYIVKPVIRNGKPVEINLFL